MKNNHGFSLMESLIVLSVVCLLLLLPTINLTESYHRYQVAHFLNQFEKAMAFAQQSAIIGGQKASVYYQDSAIKVYYGWFVAETNRQIEEIYLLPPQLSCKATTINLSFNGNTGNPSSLPKFRFFEDKTGKTYTYQINLGSGKYELTIE